METSRPGEQQDPPKRDVNVTFNNSGNATVGRRFDKVEGDLHIHIHDGRVDIRETGKKRR